MDFLKTYAGLTEKNLCKYVSTASGAPQVIKDAMIYSLSAGGKRLRPALVMICAEAFGLDKKYVIAPACAVEMVHTYSLIHDDLPAMDNDDLRRGKPTNHKVFGEAVAILSGDGLLTLAFEVFAQAAKFPKVGPQRTLRALVNFAHHAGVEGMVGGQVADIFAEGMARDASNRAQYVDRLKSSSWKYLMAGSNPEEIIQYIHAHKTAALIKASAQTGAILAGSGEADIKHIGDYGFCIGVAFQIADDILDVSGDKEKLGKKGSDKDNDKLTFVSLYGIEQSKKMARGSFHAVVRTFFSFGFIAVKQRQIRRVGRYADAAGRLWA
ncbi:MAG: polyprenyl synthetase family protein, partial [Elusimicrobia bacterium]|nr:polyprenyl synthetase family protein [Elusimicrobiota bacterium]